MSKIIVGSTALSKYKLSRGSPKDLDIWNDEQLPKEKGVDCKVIPKHILNLISTDEEGFALPNSVFTIKCSHLGWDNPVWKKHYLDVLYLKQKGCVIEDELFYSLVDYWKSEFGNKEFLSLKKNKDSFFNGYVTYHYDHDLLHKKASLPHRPVYEKCLREGQSVLTSTEKFKRLSFEEQILMLQEEIHVILYERWIIPKRLRGESPCWLKHYPESLKKTITSLTKNYWTEFLIRNIDKFYKPNINIINNLNNFLEEEKL